MGEESQNTDISNHLAVGVTKGSEKAGLTDKVKNLWSEVENLGIEAEAKEALVKAGLESLLGQAPILGTVVAVAKVIETGTEFAGIKFNESRVRDLKEKMTGTKSVSEHAFFVLCIESLLSESGEQAKLAGKKLGSQSLHLLVAAVDITGISQRLTAVGSAFSCAVFEIERMIAIQKGIRDANSYLQGLNSLTIDQQNFMKLKDMLLLYPLIGVFLFPPPLKLEDTSNPPLETFLDYICWAVETIGLVADFFKDKFKALKQWLAEWVVKMASDQLAKACDSTLGSALTSNGESAKIDPQKAQRELLTGLMLGFAPKDLLDDTKERTMDLTVVEQNRLAWFNETCKRAIKYQEDIGFTLHFRQNVSIPFVEEDSAVSGLPPTPPKTPASGNNAFRGRLSKERHND